MTTWIFGQVIKPSTTDSPFDENNYSRPAPRRVAEAGNPDEDKINTSGVERMNLSIRMGNRRYTRKTNAFSKKLENHRAMLSLWFFFYNWARPHQSLSKSKRKADRVTPAMAAGLIAHPLSLEWLIQQTDAVAPKPRRPRRYLTKALRAKGVTRATLHAAHA